MEWLLAAVQTDLGIDGGQLALGEGGQLVALVPARWLSSLRQSWPGPCPRPEGLNQAELSTLLQASVSKLPSGWARVSVQGLRKSRLACWLPSEPVAPTPTPDPDLDSFCGFMSHVADQNYQNLWREAHERFARQVGPEPGAEAWATPCLQALKASLSRVLGCSFTWVGPERSPEQEGSPDRALGSPHPNLLPAEALLESVEALYLVQLLPSHTLCDALTFSPAKLAGSHAKVLFVLYQALQAMRACHRQGLACGALTPAHLSLDERLFTRLRLNLADYEGPEGGGERSQGAATPEDGEQESCRETGSLRELVTHWVHGRLSNFAYLMALNRLAGRRWGDPNYHPVLPWVTDFTSPHGRLRDLRKSKFRLNKGDRQLDFTYREAGAGAAGSERLHVPHHIPDVLSDITYYVYRARRTPRSLLCRHVRSQWEPHEYPGSVERMQAWTPDECIPEFYTDPTIFHSVHDDMPDLEVPAWCDTPASFVAAHRRLLESPEVSLHLHHWVDLTFGHRLSGKEAVRAKNVCLPLVDAHTHLTSYGVVQLFDQPHPQRLAGPGWEPAEPPAVTRRLHPGQRRLARPVPEEEGGEAAGREPAAAEGEEEAGDLEEGTEALDSLSGLEEAPGRVGQGQREGEEEEGRILLPQGFNPLQALEELERLGGFLTRGLQGPPPQPPPPPRKGLRLPHLLHRDMQAFGVLVAEMFFAPRLRLLGPQASLDERLRVARQLACSRLREVAGPLQQAVVTLLQLESEQPAAGAEALPLHYPAVQEGLPPPSPDLLLSPCCPTIPFPAYFPGLYRLACSFPAPGEAAALLGRDFVFSLWQQLEQLLDLLEPEGLDILLPFVLELLSADATAIYAAWYLFEPLARALGPRGAQRCLLGPLSAVYERPGSLPGRFYLYTDCFVLQLLVRLGLRPFLTGLLPHILQVLTGLEGPADSPGLAASLEDEAGPTEGKAAADYLGSGPELAESEELPPGNFPAEAEAAGGSAGSSNGEASVDELGPDPDPEGRDGLHISLPGGQELRPPEEEEEEEEDAEEEDAEEEEQETEATAVLCSTPEAGACEELRKSVEEDEELSENKEQKILLDTACKTVKWLAAKLGPTLSSRHIVRTLLRLLVTCYFGVEKQQFVVSGGEDVPCANGVYKQQTVLGDVVAQPVLDCLVHVAQLYGEPVLTYQCLPYVAYLVAPSNSRRLNSRKEAGLLAAVVLMHKIIVYLSDTTLMDILPKINQDLLLPVLEVLTSPLTSFPGGAPARSVLGVKTLGLLALVCLRIGQEMVMQHMTEMLGWFLQGFSVVPDLREKLGLSADARDWAGVSETDLGGGWDLAALEELEEVFSLEMAYSAYVLFNCLIGGTPSQQLRWDDGRVQALAARYQEEVSAWASGGPTPPSPDASQTPLWWGAGVEDGQSGIFGSGVVGNRIEVAWGSAGWPGAGTGLGSRAPPPHEPGGLKQELVRSGRWLDGNWLAHWQYEVGRAHQDQRCHFHQIPLQCFRGHTSAVRALCPLPAEDFFLSASRDRTVRLWPLYNRGDGSHAVGPRLTYAQHRRPVFATQHLDTLQQVASCDGTIHIWDPFTGKSIRIFDGFDSRNPITAVTAMPSPHCSLLVGMSDSLLHFIDPRKPGLQHEFRLGMNASAGLIRCMAISPSGRSAAVGFSSGYIYLLDIRTGLILKVWPAHESDILQLKCTEGNVLVSSSTDHALTVWTESEPKPVQLYKSPSDPVHTFDLYGDEIVAGTVANRIGIYSLDGAVPVASSKLSLENFRGVLTSLAVLPAKRLLLLGSDNGSVRLLA